MSFFLILLLPSRRLLLTLGMGMGKGMGGGPFRTISILFLFFVAKVEIFKKKIEQIQKPIYKYVHIYRK